MGAEQGFTYVIKAADGTHKVVAPKGGGKYSVTAIEHETDHHTDRIDRTPSGLEIYTSPTTGKTRAFGTRVSRATQTPTQRMK